MSLFKRFVHLKELQQYLPFNGMATTATAGPGTKEEPGAASLSHVGAGTQPLGPPCAALPSPSAGSWIRGGAARVQPCAHRLQAAGLTRCATTSSFTPPSNNCHLTFNTVNFFVPLLLSTECPLQAKHWRQGSKTAWGTHGEGVTPEQAAPIPHGLELSLRPPSLCLSATFRADPWTPHNSPQPHPGQLLQLRACLSQAPERRPARRRHLETQGKNGCRVPSSPPPQLQTSGGFSSVPWLCHRSRHLPSAS